MEIPDPVAYPEERVLVLNYRRKSAQWEEGEVRDFHFMPAHMRTDYKGGTYEVRHHWTYVVWVDRLVIEGGRYGRSKGGGYALTVSDDRIRAFPLRQAKEEREK